MASVPAAYARQGGAIADRRDRRREDNDIVFVALTRPAMFWGTPIESFVFIPHFAFTAMIVGNNPLWAVVAGAFCFGLFRVLAAWDPHFARRIKLAARTKWSALNIGWFGGSSLSPRLAGRPLQAKDVFIQGWTELSAEPSGFLARLALRAPRRHA
jgi:type IV secretion system protein VirB3